MVKRGISLCLCCAAMLITLALGGCFGGGDRDGSGADFGASGSVSGQQEAQGIQQEPVVVLTSCLEELEEQYLAGRDKVPEDRRIEYGRIGKSILKALDRLSAGTESLMNDQEKLDQLVEETQGIQEKLDTFLDVSAEDGEKTKGQ